MTLLIITALVLVGGPAVIWGIGKMVDRVGKPKR